jgi:aminoglycoside phosphotransferase (APT) family kinase protein
VLDDRALRWVESMIGAAPIEVRGLRDGGAPWLLRFADRDVVLRTAQEPDAFQVERKGMVLASAHGLPVPEMIAASRDPSLLLCEAARGSSAVPRERPTSRLRDLGALAARIHRITVPHGFGLPRRERPIAGVDFDALRAAQPAEPLLERAAEVRNAQRPENPDGFVHGDLWQGNVMWDDDELSAVLDWDCAGVGPAGIDLGSLRFDAATAFGFDAASDVLTGWEEEAGRAAANVAYWDVVAALSTAPDLGWFVETINAQGRDDLTRVVMIARRDEFLAAALDRC